MLMRHMHPHETSQCSERDLDEASFLDYLLQLCSSVSHILRAEKYQKQRCTPRKSRETGAEIQTLAEDTRTVVWVYTAEKIVLRDTRKRSRQFGVV